MTANTSQAEAWNGDEGLHWATHADRYDRMTQEVTARLLAAAAIRPGESVLDVGCGCGGTTRAAARRAASEHEPGQALGVDLSEPMLAEARCRADRENVTNVRFEAADAQTAELPGGFDVALSRFGVMFFDDLAAAFTNIAAALRPGGRLAFVCWQEPARSEYLMVPFGAIAQHVPPPELPAADAPGPFSLADPDRIRTVLGKAGFGDITVDAAEPEMIMGDDVDDVIGYYHEVPLAKSLMTHADEATVQAIDASLREALLPHHGPDGVTLRAATWLVTAHR